MRTKVHKFRTATKPVAFHVLRLGLVAGVLSFVTGIFLTGAARTWAMRSFGLSFAVAVSGSLVHYVFIAADEWLAGRYGTAVWMVFWVALLSFAFYAGARIAIVGFG